MEFNEHKPIYLQIVDTICERILSGEWKEEDRIPSVRELGMDLGVNPNTVMRAYDFLQNTEVIYNKRGVGYFVSPNAKKNIKNTQKVQFVEEELQQVFKKMELLDVTMEEVSNLFKNFEKNCK